VDIPHSSWVAVRILPSVHTNPIWVEVAGKPVRASRKSAEWCLKAVDVCWDAGAGAEVSLLVGGKTDRWHGEPVAVTGVVRALSDGVFACELPDNHFASFYGNTIRMGRTAWLRVRGINLVLTERKTPPFDLAQLRGVGVIPELQKLIVVKSAVAYRAAYLPIAAGVVEMDTAGLCTANLARFPYRYLRRPIFPLDEL